MESSKKSEKQKPHQKKIFYVDPQRAELDQYMLKKIKKNGQSVKKLTAEISNLLTRISTLNFEKEKNDHYYKSILKDSSHSPSSNSKTFSKYENSQIYNLYTSRKSPAKQRSTHRKPTKGSKGSKCSSRQSHSSKEEKKHGKKSVDFRKSKHLLGKKIKDLKSQAKLAQHQRQQIKLKVNKKINQKTSDIQEKQYIQNSLRQAYLIGGFYRNQQKNDKFNKYNPQLFTNERLSNSYRQSKKYHTEQGEEKNIYFEQKRLITKNQASNQNTKTSNTSEQEQRNNKKYSIYPALQINNQFSVATLSPSSKKLNFSRCVDIQITKTQAKNPSPVSSLQKAQPKQTLQFSKLREKPKPKTRLQQLEARFDSLVRKELIVDSDIQKKQLRIEIKQVLAEISLLKRKDQYYK